jgi:hypothetical protein
VVNPLEDSCWDQSVLTHAGASVFLRAGWARVLSSTYALWQVKTQQANFIFRLQIKDNQIRKTALISKLQYIVAPHC